LEKERYIMGKNIKEAITELRETFLRRIYQGYPDHKKIWKVDEISREFTYAMYDLVLDYFDEIKGEKEKV